MKHKFYLECKLYYVEGRDIIRYKGNDVAKVLYLNHIDTRDIMNQSHLIQVQIKSVAHDTSKEWFKRQCRNPTEHMYLYYKPGHIAFHIGAEPLDTEWVLACQTRISPAKTVEQVTQQIINSAQTLPILAD